MSWEEYGDVACWCRVGVRKAKVQLELDLARDTKKNFICKYVQPKKEEDAGVERSPEEKNFGILVDEKLDMTT